MAMFQGDIRMFGSVDGMHIYTSTGDSVARSQHSKAAYYGEANAAVPVEAREGTNVARATTLLTRSCGPLYTESKDRYAKSRLQGVLQDVLEMDPVSAHGDRRVRLGLGTAKGRDLLCGFDFNPYTKARSLLSTPPLLAPDTGNIHVASFDPGAFLATAPPASTLFVQGIVSRIDFVLGEYLSFVSQKQVFTSSTTVQPLCLETGGIPPISGITFCYLWVGFYREDAVAVPELLQRANTLFRIVAVKA